MHALLRNSLLKIGIQKSGFSNVKVTAFALSTNPSEHSQWFRVLKCKRTALSITCINITLYKHNIRCESGSCTPFLYIHQCNNHKYEHTYIPTCIGQYNRCKFRNPNHKYYLLYMKNGRINIKLWIMEHGPWRLQNVFAFRSILVPQ